MVSLGDLDGDGIRDIAMGERGNGPYSGLGLEDPDPESPWYREPVARDRVWILSGSDGSPIRCLQAPGEPCSVFGRDLAATGDLDGDGLEELAVAGWRRVWIFDGKDGRVLHELSSPGSRPDRVRSVAGGRDVDGDGRPDLLVLYRKSARLYSGPEARLVRVISTKAPEDGIEGVKWLQFEGRALGAAATLLGDRDGDGLAEVGFTLRGYRGGDGFPLERTRHGNGELVEVVQILGQGATKGTEVWELPPRRGAAARILQDPGDLDGDGRPDLLFSEPNECVVALADNGSRVIRRHDYRGGSMRSEGSTLEVVADHDGDGVRDYLISANEALWDCQPGFATVVSGATGEVLATRTFASWEYDSGCGPGVDACPLSNRDGTGSLEYVLHLPRQQDLWLCSGEDLEVLWSVSTDRLQLPGVPPRTGQDEGR